jgi:RND family efflux transporter MFP subunit
MDTKAKSERDPAMARSGDDHASGMAAPASGGALAASSGNAGASSRALLTRPSLPVEIRQPSPERSRSRRLRPAILFLLLAALAGGGWLLWQGRPAIVTTATAHVGPAAALVYATGFVEPEHPVSVGARVTAPVLRVLVDEGDHIRRGQPLATLESEQQQGLVAQAAAQRRQAVLDEARKVTLFGQGWVTRAARDAAVATADSARAAERSTRGQLDQYVVRAGIDGIVLKRDVEPGSLVTPANVLFVLGNPNRARITATIDERDVPLIHVGQPALMKNDAWPGRVIRGHVTELTPAGDPLQRAFRARLGLDEATTLPFGMTLEVNIVTDQTDHALLVPAQAVKDGRLWVARAGRAYSRKVAIGIAGADQIQILRGLKPDERIILDPPAGLREAGRIRTTK